MDYSNEQAKIPFYMTFPMQNIYLMEMEYERDLERMRAMYPKEVNRLMPYIEKHCDELEYEGSRIYDENPDTRMMEEEVAKVCEEIKCELEKQDGNVMDDAAEDGSRPDNEERLVRNMGVSERGTCSSCSSFALNPPEGWVAPLPRQSELAGMDRMPQNSGNRKQEQCDSWLCSMVGVLFNDEIYRRRCRNRRCRRWW